MGLSSPTMTPFELVSVRSTQRWIIWPRVGHFDLAVPTAAYAGIAGDVAHQPAVKLRVPAQACMRTGGQASGSRCQHRNRRRSGHQCCEGAASAHVSWCNFVVRSQQEKNVKKATNWLWFVSPRTLRVSHTMGLPFHFTPASKLYSHTKSVDIDRGWPTFFAGRERPVSDEFGA